MFLAGCPRFPVLRLGRALQVIAQRVPQLDDPLGQSAEAAFGVARPKVDDRDQADMRLDPAGVSAGITAASCERSSGFARELRRGDVEKVSGRSPPTTSSSPLQR